MNSFVKNAMSPWTSGFQGNLRRFNPASIRRPLPTVTMGQAATAVSQAVRDQTLATLNDAWLRAAAIDSWRSENPDWQLAMGKDGDQVAQLTSSAAPLLATAQKVRTTLQGTDPASWIVTSQEITDANSWATMVSTMYGLVAKHSTSLRPVTSGTPVIPGAPAAAGKTDYTIPIAIGAGALLLLGLFLWKGRGE